MGGMNGASAEALFSQFFGGSGFGGMFGGGGRPQGPRRVRERFIMFVYAAANLLL